MPDVLVIGGGNAALCAAMTARRAGARVRLLESASEAERGGNSRHTRNIRYAHERASTHLTGPYSEDEFWSDLQRVTGGETDEALARLAIRESRDLGTWMPEQRVQWQAPLRGTLQLSRTNAFFLGGGKALINAYYDTAQKLGVEIQYDAEVSVRPYILQSVKGKTPKQVKEYDRQARVEIDGELTERAIDFMKRNV